MQQQLPFIPDQLYNRRRDIHSVYGGNWQSGICPSGKFPYIFIFSGKSGKQHGYEDGWDNPNVFTYTGEGQSGDMEFTRGNLALLNHIKNGKRVFLFESQGGGYVKFVSEVEYHDVDYFETPDTSGNSRIGIKFFFKRIGIQLPIIPSNVQSVAEPNLFAEYAIKPPNKTERKGLITSRVGQGAYRKRIIHRWEYQCAVTGFDKLDVLVASHIVPWSKSNDNERLDVDNGLLLSPTFDALFDRHLISFENQGQILLSESIEKLAYQKIGVSGNEVIDNLSLYNLGYLDRHRDRFYESH
ncbi:MAG: 5-methylcytosine-specific restriction protein A [Psychroserpens sp.]|jgi:5-methylcytosine-specific restriction protein A